MKIKTYLVRSHFYGLESRGYVTGDWHQIKARTVAAARRKFMKGTDFKTKEVQVKPFASARLSAVDRRRFGRAYKRSRA
jgi:hypothetical protein